MTTPDLERQIIRWKIMAIIAVTLAVGVVGGLLFGYATAQGGGGIQKVQLDTSNCRAEVKTGYDSFYPPAGSIAGGILVINTQYSQQTVIAYTTCD